MKINEQVRNRLIKELKEQFGHHERQVYDLIEMLKTVQTVEEIMKIKKVLLLNYIELLPIGTYECYFCLLQMHERLPSPGKSLCESCQYGKHHGLCIDNPNSQYNKMIIDRDNLINCINNYYNDELYEDNS